MKYSLRNYGITDTNRGIIISIVCVLLIINGALLGLGYYFISFVMIAALSVPILLSFLLPRPEWILSWIIISAPLTAIQVDIGVMVVTLSELLLFLGAIVLVLRLIARRTHFPHTDLTLPILLLGCMFIIGFIRFPEWSMGSYEIGSLKTVYAFLMGALVYFLSLDSINSADKRKFIVYSWAISAGVAIAVGWYFYFTGQIVVRDDVSITGIQSYLGKGHAAYLMYAVAMILPLAILIKRRVTKTFFLIVIANALVQILLGSQRAAWISLIFVFIVFFVLSGNSSNRWGMRLFYISLMGILVFTFSLSIAFLLFEPLDNHRVAALSSSLTGGDISVRNRSLIWQRTLELVAQRPFDGYGLGAFRRLYLQGEYVNSVVVSLGERGLAVHNTFLEVALDTGLPGLVILLWIVWIGLVRSWKIFKLSKNSTNTAIGLGSLLVIVHFLVWGMTDTLIIKLVDNNFLFFSTFGILGSFCDSNISAS